MLVEAVAQQAVRAGQGLGLSDAVLREMLRRQGGSPEGGNAPRRESAPTPSARMETETPP
jgi:hypothetical protein